MNNLTLKPDEGIGLKLSSEIKQMDVLLLPEDIGPLCRELLNAKAKHNRRGGRLPRVDHR